MKNNNNCKFFRSENTLVNFNASQMEMLFAEEIEKLRAKMDNNEQQRRIKVIVIINIMTTIHDYF